MSKFAQVASVEALTRIASAEQQQVVESYPPENSVDASNLRVCGNSSHSPLFPLVYSEARSDGLAHAYETGWQGPAVQGVKEAWKALTKLIGELSEASESGVSLKPTGADALRQFAEEIKEIASRPSPEVQQALELDSEIIGKFAPLVNKLKSLVQDKLIQARNGTLEGSIQSTVRQLEDKFRNLINAVRAEVGLARQKMLAEQARRDAAAMKNKVPTSL